MPANEAPKEVLIYNHNESLRTPHAPDYIFLYIHRAPTVGGETPISSSIELFQRAAASIPDFVATLTSKGILNRVTYKTTPQFAGGSTIFGQAFGTEILAAVDAATRKVKVEFQLRRYNRGSHTTWEWIDNDGTLVVSHPIPLIRVQPITKLPVLLTWLAAYYKSYYAPEIPEARRKKASQQLYGDGTPIPEEYLEKLAEIAVGDYGSDSRAA